MVDIEVTIDKGMELLTRISCTWKDILGRDCVEKIEIRNEQIPELIKKLTLAMESTGIITIEPETPVHRVPNSIKQLHKQLLDFGEERHLSETELYCANCALLGIVTQCVVSGGERKDTERRSLVDKKKKQRRESHG